MNLSDIIRARRTVGAFAETPFDPALILDLLDTAVYAPNHHMTEPWRFVLLVGEGRLRYAEARRALALAKSRAADALVRQQEGDGAYRKFARVPGFLAVIMREATDAETRDEDYAATAALIQNFLLLATERGLGTIWKTYKDHPALRELLQLQADEIVVGLIHLGYPVGSDPATPRTPGRNKTTMIA